MRKQTQSERRCCTHGPTYLSVMSSGKDEQNRCAKTASKTSLPQLPHPKSVLAPESFHVFLKQKRLQTHLVPAHAHTIGSRTCQFIIKYDSNMFPGSLAKSQAVCFQPTEPGG